MKTTVEITRDALLSMVLQGVGQDLGIRPDKMNNAKLKLSKTSRGQHILTFDSDAPIADPTIGPDKRPDI